MSRGNKRQSVQLTQEELCILMATFGVIRGYVERHEDRMSMREGWDTFSSQSCSHPDILIETCSYS